MTYKRDFNMTPNQQSEVLVICHENLLGICRYPEPKWGRIFWKIQRIKIEPVNPPPQNNGGHLGSRYVYTHT